MLSESRDNRVDLSVFSPTLVKGMLEYIYTDKTDLTDADPGEWLRIADMYELAGLKSDAACVISESLSVQNAAEAFQLSSLYNLEVLKTTVIEFIKQYEQNIHIYSFHRHEHDKFPHFPRNGIGRAVAAHPTFTDFVRTNPAAAVELFAAILN